MSVTTRIKKMLSRAPKCIDCGAPATHDGYGTGPGVGQSAWLCDVHWRARDWPTRMGMTGYDGSKPIGRPIRIITNEVLTRNSNGHVNAFGSVLSEYDSGHRLPFICGHGGSAWLCPECAVRIAATAVLEA